MQLERAGVFVPLVLCGHMHHRLIGEAGKRAKSPSLRRMVHVSPSGTVVLNAATVPRVTALQPPSGRSEPLNAAAHVREPELTLRHFLTVGRTRGLPREGR
jgi:hypothetical protein